VRIVEQQVQEVVGSPEGHVRDHPKRLARESHLDRVALDHLDIAPAARRSRLGAGTGEICHG
jgi:hypothetical protein